MWITLKATPWTLWVCGCCRSPQVLVLPIAMDPFLVIGKEHGSELSLAGVEPTTLTPDATQKSDK